LARLPAELVAEAACGPLGMDNFVRHLQTRYLD